MMRAADYIIKFLEKNNVKHIFMLTGGGCMYMTEAVGNSEKIKYICNHHEQACAMSAEAYAKMTGELGVVLVTSGPGATNTITGLVGAFQDSVPCLFLSGQAKRQQTVYNSKISKLRQFGVQEANIVPIVESITKYAVMVNEPEKIRYHLEKAIYLAKAGRPGPVWLDIPLDVQGASVDEAKLKGFDASELALDYKEAPRSEEIKEVITCLKNAKRPVIIAGHGIRLAGACKELSDFAARLKIPVVTPIMGIDVINSDHKSYIGRIGTKGTRAGNFAMQNADLIISIGSRLSVSVVGHEYKLFAREAKIVVIDIDPEEHKKKTIRIDKFINSNAKVFLKEVSKAAGNKKFNFSKIWLKTCNIWKNKYPVCLPEYKKESKSINFYYFMERLNKIIKADVPIISDAGSCFYIVSQAVNIQKGQRYVTSGGLATMGFGLPAAIGASAGIRNKEVAVITGDGSFQQNIQELQTIAYNKLPIKIFVINNSGYLTIRQTQIKFFNGHLVGEGPRSGVSFPELEKISKAYGIKFIKASNSDNLDKILDGVFKYTGPVICEVKVPEDQSVIPTNTAAIKPDGTMVSKPLEDMYPFLDRREFLSNMIVRPCTE